MWKELGQSADESPLWAVFIIVVIVLSLMWIGDKLNVSGFRSAPLPGMPGNTQSGYADSGWGMTSGSGVTA